MWEPMAQALGYPKQAARLRRHPQARALQPGLGRVRPAEFGALQARPHQPRLLDRPGCPRSSPSTTAATGKKEGLSEHDITGKARATVKDIERSIVHYGDTTLFIADQMRKRGPGLRVGGRDGGGDARRLQPRAAAASRKLVAIYPEGGHVLLRQPVHRARRAVGHAPSRRPGAQAFQRLPGREAHAEVTAAQYGFRPADLEAKPAPPLTAANGVDPDQPERVLGLPEPRVLGAAQAPGARTASRRTCCSSSTRRAR